MAAPVSACITHSLHSGVTSKHGAITHDFLTGLSVTVTQGVAGTTLSVHISPLVV
jgi:hypothetical protein